MRTVFFTFLILFIFSPLSYAKKVTPQFIVAHITDTRNDYTLEMCNNGHRARGWKSCGYNWLIYRNGEIVESRGREVGAHAKGFNSVSYGIGLVGKDNATGSQIESFRSLVKVLGNLPLKPHFELNSNKTCPTKEVWSRLVSEMEKPFAEVGDVYGLSQGGVK